MDEQKPAAPTASPSPALQSAPVMDVRPAPPPEKTDSPTEDLPEKLRKGKPEESSKKPAKPKKPGEGVGMAIAATVIIVLGLAVLATYAFLKTQK